MFESLPSENGVNKAKFNGAEYTKSSQDKLVYDYIDFSDEYLMSHGFLTCREPQSVERIYYKEKYSIAQKRSDDRYGYRAIGDILISDYVTDLFGWYRFNNPVYVRSDIKKMEFKPENVKSVSFCSGSLGEEDLYDSVKSFETSVEILSGNIGEDELEILKTYTDSDFVTDFVQTAIHAGLFKEAYNKIKDDIDGNITAIRLEFKDESFPFSLVFSREAISPTVSIDERRNLYYAEHGADLDKLDVCDKDIEDFGKAAFPKQAQKNGVYNLKKSDVEKISGKLYTRSEYDGGYYCVLRLKGQNRYLFFFFNQNNELVDSIYYCDEKWGEHFDALALNESTLNDVKAFAPDIALQNNGAESDGYVPLVDGRMCHVTFDSKTQIVKNIEYFDSCATENLTRYDKRDLCIIQDVTVL
ncbi:MAG: hypothetical protein ACI4XH_07670 [Acutalibacteraceae bacterium]